MFISPHKMFAPANSDGDSIILSRLDCDVYKFVMGQFIWKQGVHGVPVTFGFKVRTKGVQLGKIIPEQALREQLNALRSLRFTETELSQLAGMTITGKNGTRHMFELPFIDVLRKLALPDFDLEYRPDGTIKLQFSGPWLATMFWETAAMAIISELYYWHLWKAGFESGEYSSSDFSSFYAQWYQRTIDTCNKLKQYPGLTFSQFGHRRRHCRQGEVIVQDVFNERIPLQCTAPSNVWLAFRYGMNNPKGTNAHEQFMVWATLNGNTDEWIVQSPYDLVRKWNAYYPELAILLPDTFGTLAFINNAPEDIVRTTNGVRIDSGDEKFITSKLMEWFKGWGEDPKNKTFIPSDGLDADRMIDLYNTFAHIVGVETFGLGTLATNNINGIFPESTGFHTLSMVIKVTHANGFFTVKLSDNSDKATSESPAEKERYMRLFPQNREFHRTQVV